MPSMGPQIHGWDPDIATGCPYGRRLEKPIRGLSGTGYVAPAHGRGWHPPSFDPFEAIAHDGEAGGVADSGAQCPVTGAGGPGGDDGGGGWCAECLPVASAVEERRGGCEGVAVGGVGGQLALMCAWRAGDGISLDLRHFPIALRLASRRPAHTGHSVDTTAFVETTAAGFVDATVGNRLSSSSQTVMTSARRGRVAVRRRAMTLRGVFAHG